MVSSQDRPTLTTHAHDSPMVGIQVTQPQSINGTSGGITQSTRWEMFRPTTVCSSLLPRVHYDGPQPGRSGGVQEPSREITLKGLPNIFNQCISICSKVQLNSIDPSKAKFNNSSDNATSTRFNSTMSTSKVQQCISICSTR